MASSKVTNLMDEDGDAVMPDTTMWPVLQPLSPPVLEPSTATTSVMSNPPPQTPPSSPASLFSDHSEVGEVTQPSVETLINHAQERVEQQERDCLARKQEEQTNRLQQLQQEQRDLQQQQDKQQKEKQQQKDKEDAEKEAAELHEMEQKIFQELGKYNIFSGPSTSTNGQQTSAAARETYHPNYNTGRHELSVLQSKMIAAMEPTYFICPECLYQPRFSQDYGNNQCGNHYMHLVVVNRIIDGLRLCSHRNPEVEVVKDKFNARYMSNAFPNHPFI